MRVERCVEVHSVVGWCSLEYKCVDVRVCPQAMKDYSREMKSNKTYCFSICLYSTCYRYNPMKDVVSYCLRRARYAVFANNMEHFRGTVCVAKLTKASTIQHIGSTGSTRSVGSKLYHKTASTNNIMNSYFYHLPKLWNCLTNN